ncbi:zinc finger CCCH domain-containing protein 34-like [Typha angustifolia]|uniref:zinc finger CCCH domain-containing protein 34-like n=1 Tax=Typha angustifolia TaxID=59011 RepID=UPI003C2C04E6
MEEENRKKSTDCIYFLASPFTCKKGSECEYRHSESARLNHRDCWYWLNGNCLSSSCGFRHPPSDSTTLSQPTSITCGSVPLNKMNVPCYFYYSAYCIKGDHCPFLHDFLPGQKIPRNASEATTPHPVENEISTRSDTWPASLEVPVNPCEITSEQMENFHSKEVLQQPHDLLEEESSSVEVTVSECEEPATDMPNNEFPFFAYSSDQSSKKLTEEHTKPDEWLESSPGFDVLVDDEAQQSTHEDELDYHLAQERESEVLHGNFIHYGFKESADYLSDYPNSGHSYEPSMYGSYDSLDEYPDYAGRSLEHFSDRKLEPTLHRKRKYLFRGHGEDARDGADLREHLSKNRGIGIGLLHHNCQIHCNSREQLVSHKVGWHQSRFGLEPGNISITSKHNEIKFKLNYRQKHGCLGGYPPSDRHARTRRRERGSRRRRKSKRLPSNSEVLKHSSPKVKSIVTTATFAGPKTLAQIKEEKNRTKTNVDGMPRYTGRSLSYNDFERPKLSNEFLKDKKGPPTVCGKNTGRGSTSTEEHPHISIHQKTVGSVCFCEDNEQLGHGTSEKEFENYENDFILKENNGDREYVDDEDEDEDDDLRKKIAHILVQ